MTPPSDRREPTGPTTPSGASGGIDLGRLDLGEPGPLAGRSKGSGGRSWVVPALLAAALGGGAGFYGWTRVARGPGASPLRVALPATIDVREAQGIDLQVGVEAVGIPLDRLRFRLVDPPDGASIDARSGRLTWTPTEAQGPGTHPLVVEVAADGSPAVTATGRSVVTVREVASPLRVAAIGDQASDGKGPVRLTVQAQDDDLPASGLVYELEPGAPTGARIDPASGAFEWDPAGQDSGTYPVAVRVRRKATADPSPSLKAGAPARAAFAVRVEVRRGPVERILVGFGKRGLAVEPPTPTTADALTPLTLTVAGEAVTITRFEAKEAIAPALAKLGREVTTASVIQTVPVALYADDSVVVRHDGSNAGVADVLGELLGSPQFERQVTPPDVVRLVELARDPNGRLFLPKEYKTLRRIFADRFEARNEVAIHRGFGEDHAAVLAWLRDRPELREEFFTALDPERDDVPAALRLFKAIKDGFPDKVEKFGQLAIATAVTWDQERGVYNYAGHQHRTQAKMPDGLLDALGSFRFLTESQGAYQGRLQYLPWEFLLYVVDHRTPAAERRWALANYGADQSMIGKCYGEVPYDGLMLETHDRETRLKGQLYTLANLKTYGGVCSQQADYAARVGKSNGIPAASVGGPGAWGGPGHAWVMWVELKDVTPTRISFTLESHGRYRGDKYYVGTLDDPQTGREITDRQLELRLHTFGTWPLARRHAGLIMRAFPLIRDQASFSTAEQIRFLFRVIDLCPGDEAAWLELARLSREGQVTAEHKKPMAKALDHLFTTFADFPDFTWAVFDDLIAPQTTPPQRIAQYGRLIQTYEAADRPDLACEARLKQADLLVAANRPADAVEGLSTTVGKFPDEGRYVPKLLDRLEAICREQKVAAGLVVRFYAEFLPKIPQKRGETPSNYCMATYQRAIDLFQRNGQAALARDLSAELAALKAAIKKR